MREDHADPGQSRAVADGAGGCDDGALDLYREASGGVHFDDQRPVGGSLIPPDGLA